MPRRLNLPDSASVAIPDQDGRLFAPSAARNIEAIADLIAHVGPEQGRALELASGTGQHISALAKRFPQITWQPSEVDAARRDSITAYVAQAGLDNVAPVAALDATAPGWGAAHGDKSLIFLSNLLHLVSDDEAETLVKEAAQALAPGGVLVIYGPFMHDDELISEGDAEFHASLQAQDPEIGYKCVFDVLDWGVEAGLEVADMIEMPANNLSLVWRRIS